MELSMYWGEWVVYINSGRSTWAFRVKCGLYCSFSLRLNVYMGDVCLFW